MIVLNGKVQIPAGSIDRVRPAMQKILDASRQETGCVRYAFGLDVLDDSVVHISEAWTDRDALGAHVATPHVQEWMKATAELGINMLELRLYDTDEGELL